MHIYEHRFVFYDAFLEFSVTLPGLDVQTQGSVSPVYVN